MFIRMSPSFSKQLTRCSSYELDAYDELVCAVAWFMKWVKMKQIPKQVKRKSFAEVENDRGSLWESERWPYECVSCGWNDWCQRDAHYNQGQYAFNVENAGKLSLRIYDMDWYNDSMKCEPHLPLKQNPGPFLHTKASINSYTHSNEKGKIAILTQHALILNIHETS